MYIGSGEHSVQLRVLGSEAIEPGACGAVRLRFPTLLPLMPGDRYVLRESGRNETVGGGEVLDVAPVLAASRAAPNRSVDRVVRERGWVHTDELARLTGERRDPNVGNWVVDPEALAEARSRVRSRIDGAGPLGLDVAELDERERALVASLPGVEVRAGRARPAEAVSPLANHPFVMALEANPFAPPSPSEVDKGELRELVRSRLVVERDGLYFSPAAIAAAASAVARMLSNRQDGFTVSELRETLGTTRKFLLPILAELDATGVTRRRGDRRIGGPRLPPPPPPSPS